MLDIAVYWTKFGRHDTTVDYRVSAIKGTMIAIEKKKEGLSCVPAKKKNSPPV